jgi:hypothetical protein
MRPKALITWCICLAASLCLAATAAAQGNDGEDPDDKASAQVGEAVAEEDEAGAEAGTAAAQEDGVGAQPGEAATADEASVAGTAAEDDAAAPEDRADAPKGQGSGDGSAPDASTRVLDAEEGAGEPRTRDGPAAESDVAHESDPDAQETAAPTPRPTLQVGAFFSEFRLDGRLDDPTWRAPDSIGNLTMVQPGEGGVPTNQTTAKMLTSSGEILIGVVCYYQNPAAIVSFCKARDADLTQKDHVLIVLDPFQDGRSGYVFAVNPSGARFDGLKRTTCFKSPSLSMAR